ncbi:MAG: flagellar hook-length control protein FliK, partial [Thiobacillaceae bacterium]|nr:flagellar hook-length control protein FliK [Thiobacillaceae bacterium]
KLDMGLPRGSQVGDTVRLTFLNAGPRPTFLLNTAPVAPLQPVRISQTAQQVNALMRVAQPAAAGAAPAAAAATPAGAPSAAAQRVVQASASGMVKNLAAASPAMPASTPAAAPAAAAAASASRVLPPQAVAVSASAKAARAVQGAAAAGQAAGPAQAATASQAAARPIVANVLILQSSAATPLQAPIALASANNALQGQAVDGMRAALSSGTSTRPAALADPAAPGAGVLPNRLAQTVRESGLFYESHLQRWAKGAYPFEALLNEPQARLGRDAAAQSRLAELGGMPEEAARLAGRQLQMLEGAPFQWQGLAWPGQWMQWLVERRGEGQGEYAGEEEGAAWNTELRLTLPRMGDLHARVSLRGDEVSVQLRAQESTTADALLEALPALDEALRAAGLRSSRLTVAREDL